MEADRAPFTPLPLSVLRFTGIQSYGYTDQRKEETDVEVPDDWIGDLSLRKLHTSQLRHNFFDDQKYFEVTYKMIIAHLIKNIISYCYNIAKEVTQFQASNLLTSSTCSIISWSMCFHNSMDNEPIIIVN